MFDAINWMGDPYLLIENFDYITEDIHYIFSIVIWNLNWNIEETLKSSLTPKFSTKPLSPFFSF